MNKRIYIKFCILCLFSFKSAFAQSLEPRLYSNAPIDLNFLISGYAFVNGKLPDNPAAELIDANLDLHTAIIGYARVIELFGQSGKFDIIVPSGCIDGDGTYKGDQITRNVCGLGDIKGRFSLNLYGAPALSLKEFSSYHQDIIVGVSIQVTLPTGQYDSDKLINLGANRWALKPGIGISKKINDLTLELSTAVEFYSDNDEFFSGVAGQSIKREQDPIYSTQTHLIYDFSPGLWIGLDATYYWGGQTVKNGTTADDEIQDSRYGMSMGIPINRKNSIKLFWNKGIRTRTGTDFDLIGIAWQYRFGAGL